MADTKISDLTETTTADATAVVPLVVAGANRRSTVGNLPAAIAGGARGLMSGADKTKLDGIEALADVTDAGNVAAAGAVMDSDFAGSTVGVMRRTGAGTYAVLMDNLGATAAPTVGDDSGDGYAVGSLWCDVTNDNVYVCIDASVGAAIWRAIVPQAVRDRSVSSDVTLSNETDEVVRVDSSGGNRQLTLPDPARKRSFLIKKTSTGTNTTTLVRFGSEQIEGASASYLLPGSANTDRPAWAVWSDGTNWWVA
jgi:hypothetical protein